MNISRPVSSAGRKDAVTRTGSRNTASQHVRCGETSGCKTNERFKQSTTGFSRLCRVGDLQLPCLPLTGSSWQRQTSHKNFTSRLFEQQYNNLTSSLQAHRYLQLPFTSTRFQTTSQWRPPTQPTSPTAQQRRSRPSLLWEARLLTADMAVVLKSRRYHILRVSASRCQVN